MARPRHCPNRRRVLSSRLTNPLTRLERPIARGIRKSHMSRSRPGRSARLDTRTYHNASNPVLRKLAFHRLVMQLAEELPKADLGLQSAAISSLQEVTQNYLNEILKGIQDAKETDQKETLPDESEDVVDSLSVHTVKAQVHNTQDSCPSTELINPSTPVCSSCKRVSKKRKPSDSIYDPEDTMICIDLDQTTFETVPSSSRDFPIDLTLNIEFDDDSFHSAENSPDNTSALIESSGEVLVKEHESMFSVSGLQTAVWRLFMMTATVSGVTSIVKGLHQSLGRMSSYFKRR